MQWKLQSSSLRKHLISTNKKNHHVDLCESEMLSPINYMDKTSRVHMNKRRNSWNHLD